LAVFLSGLVLIQYLQLLLSKNAYEVKTLLRLGYHPKLITKTFLMYFVKIFGLISLFGFLMFILLKFLLDEVFISGGLYIQTNFELWVLIAIVITFGLFTLASFQNAKRGVKKEW
jgi:predicted lysophospholipase L1 biosynthesis ABC-type transport system permease subunit